MHRREISNFELVAEDGRYPCAVPCSTREVLSSAGADTENIGRVGYECVIKLDSADLAYKKHCLRVRGLTSRAKVFIGDSLVCEADGVSANYNISASDFLTEGDNRIAVYFNSVAVDDIGSVGLTAPILLDSFSTAIIDEVYITQNHDGGKVYLNLSLDTIGDPNSVRAVATLRSPVGQMYFCGLYRGKGSIIISDPLFWWPSGQGVQNLYSLTVNLYGEDIIEDSVETTLGLRTAVTGNNGTVVVNGLNILPMGALYIPESDADTDEGRRRAERYVSAAVMSNYNCLVVPLGSPIPTERFYELCDKNGIMVIEEHSATKLLDLSVSGAIRERSCHPCLCLIDVIDPTSRAGELKSVIASLPGISFNIIREQYKYIAMPSLPSMSTIAEVVPDGERTLFSYSMEQIAEPGAMRGVLLSVADRYPYPPDLSGFSYASAMASAHKVGDSVKQSRLSYGRAGRAIFNRLNDPRLSISVSAIDSRGRWKPLQYYAARHFSPISIYTDMNGQSVIFSVSSQRRLDCIGRLEYRIADANNRTVYKNSVECEITGMTSTVIHTAEIGEYIKGHEREYYLEYYITEGGCPISRKTTLFVPEKHFAFKKPKIKAVVSGGGKNFSLTLSADCFVKDMELGFEGVDVVFEENYFDITGEAPIKVNFTLTGGAATTYQLKDALRLRSVVDLVNL